MADNEDIKKELMGLLGGAENGAKADELLPGLLSKLSPEERVRVAGILQNPDKQKELLNSPLAKTIMKKYPGAGKKPKGR